MSIGVRKYKSLVSKHEGLNKASRTLRAKGGLRSAYWASLVLDYVAESVISLEDSQGDM